MACWDSAEETSNGQAIDTCISGEVPRLVYEVKSTGLELHRNTDIAVRFPNRHPRLQDDLCLSSPCDE